MATCACGEAAIYRCPACDARSCSLACVQRHKAVQSCSGVRDKSGYRSVQAFDDAALFRDYSFLEGVTRAVDSGKRTRRETAQPVAAMRNGGLTPARQNLLHHARERGVQLELLPHGMTRQRENSTRYDGRRRSIGWRVELRFVDAGVLHVLPCVPESCSLMQLLRSCLEPNVQLFTARNESTGGAHVPASRPRAEASCEAEVPPAASAPTAPAEPTATSAASAAPTAALMAATAAVPPRRDEGPRALLRHKLRSYGKAGAAQLRVYLAVECRRADDRRYKLLPLEASLREALHGTAVIEFPTLHIVLPGEPRADTRFPLL